MQHLPEAATDPEPGWSRLLSLLDPYRYVLAADDALRNGSRDSAVALIAQAYLAFDLLSPDCD